MLRLSLSVDDPGCVKTHTEKICRKNNSLAGRRTGRAGHYARSQRRRNRRGHQGHWARAGRRPCRPARDHAGFDWVGEARKYDRNGPRLSLQFLHNRRNGRVHHIWIRRHDFRHRGPDTVDAPAHDPAIFDPKVAPSVQPRSRKLRARAATRACPSGSLSARLPSTLTRRSRSPCCAGAASGQAAAVPSPAMNSRRRRKMPICPPVAQGGRYRGRIARPEPVSPLARSPRTRLGGKGRGRRMPRACRSHKERLWRVRRGSG